MPDDALKWIEDCFHRINHSKTPHFDPFPKHLLPLSSRNAIIALIAMAKCFKGGDVSFVLSPKFCGIMSKLVEETSTYSGEHPSAFSVDQSLKCGFNFEVNFDSYDQFLSAWKKVYNFFAGRADTYEKTCLGQVSFDKKDWESGGYGVCICYEITKDSRMAKQLYRSVIDEIHKIMLGCERTRMDLADHDVKKHFRFVRRFTKYLLRTDILHIDNPEGVLEPLMKASFNLPSSASSTVLSSRFLWLSGALWHWRLLWAHTGGSVRGAACQC